jgi:iduronate 2-sulfatase
VPGSHPSSHSLALSLPVSRHQEWCKETVFELSLRIPLIIRDPLAVVAPGSTSRVFAENIDIYRTLAELAGLPSPEAGVDGTSLAPLLRDVGAESAMRVSKPAAFGQHARCLRNASDGYKPIDPFTVADSCTMTPRDQLDWMGYSIRTDDWRYTAWVKWDGSTLQPEWTSVNATELYPHTVHPTSGPTDQVLNRPHCGRPEPTLVYRHFPCSTYHSLSQTPNPKQLTAMSCSLQ